MAEKLYRHYNDMNLYPWKKSNASIDGSGLFTATKYDSKNKNAAKHE